MAKQYYLTFGAGDPRTYTGLAPTMLIFVRSDGTTLAPPGISEVLSGSGLYYFTYGVTQSIAFLADAATTSPGTQGRYIRGSLDPADRADEYGNTLVAIATTNVALGTTNVAIGTTITAIATSLAASGVTVTVSIAGIGTTASSFGTSNTDPGDLFGYMKRILENLEGNQTFLKASGSLTQFSRGSSVTLYSKTIANSVSTVIKS
jgi:hypothetical protein